MNKDAFGSYRGIAYLKKKQTNNAQGQATTEASDRPRPSRGAAVSDRLFLPAPPERLRIALETSPVAGAAPKPHAGGSDGDTAIELLSEVVTWSVLV